MLNKIKSQNGFTIIEIIAVFVIIGILAAITVSRSVSYDVEVYSGADSLKMHLRYAQTLAMNTDPNVGSNTVWGINYASGANQYWLFRGTVPSGDIRALPDQVINEDRKVALNAKKIKISSSFTVFFDERGIPYSAYPGTPITSALTFSVTPLNGSEPHVNITITPRTGYIP